MKKILAIACAIIMSGCANLTLRPICDYNQGPYYCTSQINNMIERGIDGHPISRIFLPVLFIDWPFDAITDTLLWPWDAIMYSRRFKAVGTPSNEQSEKEERP